MRFPRSKRTDDAPCPNCGASRKPTLGIKHFFSGQAGCGCCPGGPCVNCAACDGTGENGCVGDVCQNFVLEVAGFANSETTDQDTDTCGGTGTGTLCEAYNGTFLMIQESQCNGGAMMGEQEFVEGGGISGCCEWRSEPFTATVPSQTIVDGKNCTTCEEVDVLYRMKYYGVLAPTEDNPPVLVYSHCKIFLEIARADDLSTIAHASPAILQYEEEPKPTCQCNATQWTENPSIQFYFLRWGARYGLMTDDANCLFEDQTGNRVAKCGDPPSLVYFSYDLATNDCYQWCFDALGVAFEVRYPFWHCCKDASWNGCTTMEDWAQNGVGYCYPVDPVTFTNIGDPGILEWFSVSLTCAD